MIAHVSIGVRDIDRSKRFYEAALEPLGYKCLRAARTLLGYGYGRDSIALWIVQAEHPVPADEKSGLHFCFTAENAAGLRAPEHRGRASGVGQSAPMSLIVSGRNWGPGQESSKRLKHLASAPERFTG